MKEKKDMKKNTQREIIISCLLGDGCLCGYKDKNGKRIYTSLRIKHSKEQYDYLYWKADLLNKLQYFKKNGVIKDSLNISKSGKTYEQKYFSINNAKYLRILGKWMYVDGKKIVKNVLKYINSPLGLAIWFMDDGGLLRQKRKHKNGDEYFLKPSSKLCTHSFTYEENELISKYLEKTFNIKSRILKDKKYYYLWFNKDDTFKIWNIIKMYVYEIPSMKKKFDLCIFFYDN